MGADRLGRRAEEGGYSLVELLVAVTIFGLVFAAVSAGMGGALNVTRNNRNRSVAAYLAATRLDEARLASFASVTPGRTVSTATVSGTAYTLTRDVTWVTPTSTTSSCNMPNGSSGAAVAYKRISVQVTWPDMRGVAPVSSQTLLAPPVGAYDPFAGHVAVHLLDRDASPLAGHTVNLSGPAAASQVTTGDGCAFFAYLNPGTYTVTLSTPGHVDRQGNQPASQVASVQAAQVTTVQFDYDRAASLQIGLAAPPAAVLPDGIAVTVFNGNLTVGTRSFPGTGTTRTVGPLFPYTSGYQVWAGDCADADPGSHPGGSRDPALPADPGGSSPGSAALAAVDVTVQDGTGTPVPGARVQGVHAAASGCPAGETLTSAAAVTDPTGNLRLALPYGTWTIQVTSPAGGTEPQVVLGPGAPVPAVTVTVP